MPIATVLVAIAGQTFWIVRRINAIRDVVDRSVEQALCEEIWRLKAERDAR